MAYSVFDIAHWFLQKEEMSHKKLQKLCYYAQAWSLALDGERIIDGDFEAWVHGPVNRGLWYALREQGYFGLRQDVLEKDCTAQISEDVQQLLESVWETYGRFTGYQLECLTHEERPWLEAREGLADLDASSNPISSETMKNYYRSLISAEGVGE